MHGPNTPAPPQKQSAVRAELTGSDRCGALGIEVRGAAPVLQNDLYDQSQMFCRLCRLCRSRLLCRKLVAAGYDPALALEAYRGDVLCLRVRSIGEAAGLEINAKGTGFKPFRAVRTASPMRQTAPEAQS